MFYMCSCHNVFGTQIPKIWFSMLYRRYMCSFGPEDKSDIVPDDMQTLLKSTQKTGNEEKTR